MRVLSRRLVVGALSSVLFALPLMLPRVAGAQVASFQACSQGALANCADIRLTSTLGAGIGGTNLFQVAVNNLGSQSNPALPTSIYFMTLLTGGPAAAFGTEVDALANPTAIGGATVLDASPWSVYESGDAIFLSALGNDGIGGCAASGVVGGFGQIGNTCGANSFLSFSFSTTRMFDLTQFSLAGLEFVAVAQGNDADSCNDVTPCAVTPLVVTPVVVTPEPSSIVLMLAGLSGIAAVRSRARRRSAQRNVAHGGAANSDLTISPMEG